MPCAQDKNKDKIAKFCTLYFYFFFFCIKLSRKLVLAKFSSQFCEIKYARKLVRSRIRYLFPTCMPSRTFIKIDKNNIIGRASEELPTAWQPPTSFVIVTENWKFQQSCRCCDWILSPCLIQGSNCHIEFKMIFLVHSNIEVGEDSCRLQSTWFTSSFISFSLILFFLL